MGDIAEMAGVSLMTVSRVVNKKGDVNPETRKRIEALIEEYGYRPSGIARSLATQRSGTIGLVVPDIANPYFSGMAHGITEVAYQEGFSLLLCDCEEDPERELEMVDVLYEKRVDGVLVAAPRVDGQRLLGALEPHSNVVIINRKFDEQYSQPPFGYVVNDDAEGGRSAIQLLLDYGHRKIGFLAGPSKSFGSQRRLIGYQNALAGAGLPFLPDLIWHCPPTVEGGKQCALIVLQEHPELTAIFCFNDLVAIGALQACDRLGIKVPGDLAIVGYDDIPIASWVTPSLTTCRVVVEEMGRLAVRLLIDRLRDCPDNCRNIILQPQIIRRASAP
jgi:LacI family transcriptional regulator